MDPALLLLPVGGIAAILLLLWALGGRRDAALLDADGAARRLTEDMPDFRPGPILLSGDRRIAVVLDDESRRLGLVFPVGARTATRVLAPGEVTGCRSRRRDGGPALDIDVRDGPRRQFTLPVDDPAVAAAWADRLERWRSN